MAGDREKPLETFSTKRILMASDGSQAMAFTGTSIDVNKSLYPAGNTHFVLDATTGTKICTASGQKLGFWGRTPVTIPIVSPTVVPATGTFTSTLAMSGALTNLIKALSGCGIISGATAIFA